MKLESSWKRLLEKEIAKPYFKELKLFLEQEKERGCVVYPPEDLIFNAFLHTPYNEVKVVIMGQDPYHGPGQANGLSFSVPCGIPLPPSLKNIFLEMESDLKVSTPKVGCLSHWARQGVLLLNATLTVRAGEAKSHYGKGWERFTDAVVDLLLERTDPIIFLLWGKSAQEKLKGILDENRARTHVVLTAAHPSPLSAYNGFFGCRHFSRVNKLLVEWKKDPMDWIERDTPTR